MDMHKLFKDLKDVVKNMHGNVTEAEKYAKLAHEWAECRIRSEAYKEMAKGHVSFNDSLKRVYDKYMQDVAESGNKEYHEWMSMVFGEWMRDIDHEAAEVHATLNKMH